MTQIVVGEAYTRTGPPFKARKEKRLLHLAPPNTFTRVETGEIFLVTQTETDDYFWVQILCNSGPCWIVLDKETVEMDGIEFLSSSIG